MKPNQHCVRPGVLGAGLLASGLALGQQGISISPRPYESALPIAAPALPTAGAPVPAPPLASSVRYEVSVADRTVRQALARWARETGWVHEPIHWALDKDFPVAAPAGPETFGPEFKAAVRILLSSTELTDRPVQPCFYANHVLRVIPKAELCDKTVQ
ncbi:toxin co-regulated pilus biosynthesis Q family protein [Ramlibacter sp. AN1133]|uniref:toxin co-regulated pilus biosynthesis Q family protein n=1 Tax=Ramlibacter sp. AN1133 TaxID=3133429 RepID=UPI0030BAE336